MLGEVAASIEASDRATDAYHAWRGCDRRIARQELEALAEECRATAAERRDGREAWRIRRRSLGLDLYVAVEWRGRTAYLADATARHHRGGRRGKGSERRKGR